MSLFGDIATGIGGYFGIDASTMSTIGDYAGDFYTAANATAKGVSTFANMEASVNQLSGDGSGVTSGSTNSNTLSSGAMAKGISANAASRKELDVARNGTTSGAEAGKGRGLQSVDPMSILNQWQNRMKYVANGSN